jgi:hypothetical protein
MKKLSIKLCKALLFLFSFSSALTVAQVPDLSGIWQVQGSPSIDILQDSASHGQGSVLSHTSIESLPYLDTAREQQLVNFNNRADLDPFNHCFLPGVPRIMLLDYAFQIIQNDSLIGIFFEWQQVHRLIRLDRGESIYAGIESWMGRSSGVWIGDELVVSVNDFNDRSWLDAIGNYHSSSMVVTEKYRLIDIDTLQYSATIDDAEVYSSPWTLTVLMKRQLQLPRVLEYQCQAEKEEAEGDFEPDTRLWYPAVVPQGQQFIKIDPPPLPESSNDFPRLTNGKPNLTGIYMADAGGANYGLEFHPPGFLMPPSRGVVIKPIDGILPYQQWARAERDERLEPWRGYDDPTAHCFVAGLPRSHYVPSPFYIIQTESGIAQFFERMSWRFIDTQRTTFLPDTLRLWQGDALGRWDGDSLVVKSKNYNGKAWLNEAGDVISHAATIEETYTPINSDTLLYRATIHDPIAYLSSWTIEIPLNRIDDELLEVACLEDNNDLEHLRDVRDEHRKANSQLN